MIFHCVCVCMSHIALTHAFAVVEESAKTTAVQVIQESYQETLIKLKSCWEL